MRLTQPESWMIRQNKGISLLLMVLVWSVPSRAGIIRPSTQVPTTSAISEASSPPPINRSATTKDRLLEALHAGRFSNTLQQIDSLPAPDRTSTDTLLLQATALIGLERIEEAEDLLNQSLADPNLSATYLSLPAAQYLNQGHNLQAMQLCQQGLMRNVKSSHLLYEAGRAWETIGRPRPAEILYQQALICNTGPQPMDRRQLQAALLNTLIKQQAYEKAGTLIRDPEIKIVPSPGTWVTLAQCHASEGDIPGAFEILKKVHSQPSDPALAWVQAKLYVLAQDVQGALAQVTIILQAKPTSALAFAAHHTAFVCHLGNHDSAAAQTSLAHMEACDVSSPQLALARLALSIHEGDTQSARQAMQQAPIPFFEWQALETIINHLSPPALGNALARGYYCLDQGFPRQALTTAEDACQTYPDNALVHLLRAEAYDWLQEHAQAVQAYQQTQQCLSNSSTLQFLKARAMEANNQDEQALAQYQKLLLKRPDFIHATQAYGFLLEKQEQLASAESIYAWSLNFLPHSLPLLTAYAWTLLNQQALFEFESLLPYIQNHPDIDANTITHLKGWQAYQQQDYQGAVQTLTSALHQWPGDPELCYHLGMAYWRQGDKQRGENLIRFAFLFETQQQKYQLQAAPILTRTP